MSAPTQVSSRARWPYAGPGQPRLLAASLLALVGAFLPWIDTFAGNLMGFQGGGLWTFSAGGIGLAGALMHRRTIVLGHAVVLGVVATGITVWQLLSLARLGCMPSGCFVSIGWALTLMGGALGLTAAWRLWRG